MALISINGGVYQKNIYTENLYYVIADKVFADSRL